MLKIDFDQFRNKTINKKLFLLLFISSIGLFLFLFWGINEKNFEYSIPKRLLKVLAIFLVSFSISYSSVIFQTITNNKILTPSIMGLDSLYIFIQTSIVFFLSSTYLSNMNEINQFLISSFIMILFSLILFKLLFKGESKNIYFLVLVGMVMGILFHGLATFMQILIDPNEYLVLQEEMFASFNIINKDILFICILLAFLCFILSIKDIKKLDILSLGEEQAINLGINYKFLVKKMLIIIAILVSISTVLVGPITFLGILLVSLSREILKTYNHEKMLIGAFLIGNIALFFSLFILERILNFSTTISVIINFIGGAYFIYIILKENKK